MKNNKRSSFKAGMYLLETLTAGMYNEPLSIYREYIQNSVDSIDLETNIDKSIFKVNIEIDPFEKTIMINDNGCGLPVSTAEEVLSAFGSSNKRNSHLRGFRGIGRLGGIAFSDHASFKTKAEGEQIESIQEWDCKKLRGYLSDPEKAKMSLSQVVKEISKFKTSNSKGAVGSYFSVELKGVTSFRNYIFDLQKVLTYIGQIAPVPFYPENFTFGNDINQWLSEKVMNYGVYNIHLNGIPIYKPYSDKVITTKKGSDKIVGIKKFELIIKNEVVAYGWYGVREEFLGAITKGENVSGIRVRVGNILIGDSHLLDECFRESRFNSYVIGEIHVTSPNLIPNSRRDDFIDNEYKTLFYNAVEKEVGLPLSKEIRLKSRMHAEKSNKYVESNKIKDIFRTRSKILNHSSTNQIIDEILSVFSSHKDLERILSKYEIS